MLYKNLHWQRGRPGEAGTYLVFDGPSGRIQVAVVTGLAPFAYRAGLDPTSDQWPYRAYLGPIDRHPASARWPAARA